MRERGACRDCGKEIDKRADRCKSCAGKLRGEHRTYEQLEWEDFKFRASKNRHSAACYIDGKLKTVWRHRWHWEMSNGKVPSGYHVHHRNGDPSDDRLENLELKKQSEHRSDHMKREKSPFWRGGRQEKVTCETCGRAVSRWKIRLGRYCSKECHQKSRTVKATLRLTCAHCGKEFERLRCLSNRPRHSRPFCSQDCYLKNRWGRASAEILRCGCCGKLIKPTKSQIKNSKSGKCYCSRNCYMKDRFYMTSQSRKTTPSLRPDL